MVCIDKKGWNFNDFDSKKVDINFFDRQTKALYDRDIENIKRVFDKVKEG